MVSTESIPPRRSLGNVLVIGGCGFLGHHIVRELLDSYSAHVSVLDLSAALHPFPNVPYHIGDIASKSSILPIFQSVRPQVVIHTASPPPTSTNTSLFDRVNIRGTQNLLDTAREVGTVKAFVYTSDASVLSDGVSPLLHASEAYPVFFETLRRRDSYAYTKAMAERQVLDANRSSCDSGKGELLTCSLRPCYLFGEHTSASVSDPPSSTQLVPSLLQAPTTILSHLQLTLLSSQSSPNTLQDMLYVSNAATAHIHASIALLTTSSLFPTPKLPLDNER
ncbi:MAG: hypothetical protein Q9190_007435, partial [Brigantiaea leucoxantha]